jgi:hypothetical protein
MNVLKDIEKLEKRIATKWKKMPKGWTAKSRKQFWETLVGDVEHKRTKCHDKMKDKLPSDDATWAFCQSLWDDYENKKKKKKEKEIPSQRAASSKTFDTTHFDKESYFNKLMEALRDKKITKSQQVYDLLKLARIPDHIFAGWFFDKLDKNKVTWNDLEILIDMDFFPKTFVLRKLNHADKLETAPQSFQEKYAKHGLKKLKRI